MCDDNDLDRQSIMINKILNVHNMDKALQAQELRQKIEDLQNKISMNSQTLVEQIEINTRVEFVIQEKARELAQLVNKSNSLDNSDTIQMAFEIKDQLIDVTSKTTRVLNRIDSLIKEETENVQNSQANESKDPKIIIENKNQDIERAIIKLLQKSAQVICVVLFFIS